MGRETEKLPRCSIRCLGLVAALSTILVVGGFQIAATQALASPNQGILEHSGVRSMSSSRLLEHVKGDARSVYWLGPMPEAKYTTDHSEGYIDVVTYLPQGSDLYNGNQAKLTVDTYDDEAAYVAHSYFSADGDSDNAGKGVTSDGNSVEFNADSMKSQIVWIKDVPQIVVIHYPTRQTQQNMMRDAGNLKLIW